MTIFLIMAILVVHNFLIDVRDGTTVDAIDPDAEQDRPRSRDGDGDGDGDGDEQNNKNLETRNILLRHMAWLKDLRS